MSVGCEMLYWRGHPGYEDARIGRVFNGRHPDRFPAAVLLAETEDDVVAGVRLARERGLQVSVRSGDTPGPRGASGTARC